MTIKSNIRLTPELLITAPRRSAAKPSSDGKYALYTVSTYSLDSHSERNEIKVIELETEAVTLFSDDAKNVSPQWLVKDQIIWLRTTEAGKTEFWIGKVGPEKNAYLAGTVDSSIIKFKTRELADGTIAIAFSALMDDKGLLQPPGKRERKPFSSAREYDSVLVRYWDTYVEKEMSTLWYTTFERAKSTSNYELSKRGLINALERSRPALLFPLVPQLGDAPEDFQLSDQGILILANDPDYNINTAMVLRLWYLRVENYAKPPTWFKKIDIPNFDGNFSSPVFSPNGQSAAFLSTKSALQYTDANRIFVVRSLRDPEALIQLHAVTDIAKSERWDINPGSLLWSNDGSEIFIQAEDRACTKVWKISSSLASPPGIRSVDVVPKLVAGNAISSVEAVFPLSKDPMESKLFVNISSFVDDGSFYLTDTKSGYITSFSLFSMNHLKLGLKKNQFSEINIKADDHHVHAWLWKPSDFDPKKKYPVTFLIHGGPTGNWSNAWSTRWNPAVWAEQGYVVVAPNPFVFPVHVSDIADDCFSSTGSSSFGQAYMDAMLGNWGGIPYDDIGKCFQYVEENLAFVDIDRAILAGGSYGGYMANWIAGQPLGRRFKALISHDGVFSPYSMLASDIASWVPGNFGGAPWESDHVPEAWDKYSPAKYVHNWKTPMLIIHSDKDFRCPITEGLAVFNVCRMKGIPARFLNFPDENHLVLKRENSLRWYETVLGWANSWAGVTGVELEPPLKTEEAISLRQEKMVSQYGRVNQDVW
ncbi:Alpha/Beta hydrolase protein [Bisporella sp. PMI_857]|nr:Alpha/Beta hydrolase protein [Bisporella sp. PMI_857]